MRKKLVQFRKILLRQGMIAVKDYLAGTVILLGLMALAGIYDLFMRPMTLLGLNKKPWLAILIIFAIQILLGILVFTINDRKKKWVERFTKIYRYWDGNNFILGSISNPYQIEHSYRVKVRGRIIYRKRRITVVLFSEIMAGPTSPGNLLAKREVPIRKLIETEYTKKDLITAGMTLGGSIKTPEY